MYFLALSVVVLSIEAVEKNPSKYTYGVSDTKSSYGFTNYMARNSPITYNFTYIDKAENMLRVPVLNKYYSEHKNKKKMKKSPKSTIQKIIKKNKSKSRRVYLNQATNQPTQSPKIDMDIYAEESQWKDDTATTQANMRKKPRKWNTKVARYPMPFQKLQSRRESYTRNKREEDREDVFIIKDLDEVEFLSKEKDYNIVKANVKKYW